MRYRARNMEPVLRDIGDDWLDMIEQNFEHEGSVSGRAWDELAYSTVKKRGSAHPILVHSAEMLIEMTDPDLLQTTDDMVTLRLSPSVATRAEAHQYGFMNALTGEPVPARPIVRFGPEDRARWRRWITEYLVDGDRP